MAKISIRISDLEELLTAARERFTFFGVTTNSHKKAIEHILKNR